MSCKSWTKMTYDYIRMTHNEFIMIIPLGCSDTKQTIPGQLRDSFFKQKLIWVCCVPNIWRYDNVNLEFHFSWFWGVGSNQESRESTLLYNTSINVLCCQNAATETELSTLNILQPICMPSLQKQLKLFISQITRTPKASKQKHSLKEPLIIKKKPLKN